MTDYRSSKRRQKDFARVFRVLENNQNKSKKVLFDDEGNTYNFKKVSLATNLNTAEFVVLGKRVYALLWFSDFSIQPFIARYENTVFSKQSKEFSGGYRLSKEAERLGPLFGMLKNFTNLLDDMVDFDYYID